MFIANLIVSHKTEKHRDGRALLGLLWGSGGGPPNLKQFRGLKVENEAVASGLRGAGLSSEFDRIRVIISHAHAPSGRRIRNAARNPPGLRVTGPTLGCVSRREVWARGFVACDADRLAGWPTGSPAGWRAVWLAG